MYYYLTFNGINYIREANYDRYHCRSLITYDQNGNVVSVNEDNYGYEDLIFGGGYYWALRSLNGIIFKLDANLNVIRTIKIRGYEKFGKTNYGNEIGMHLEYIDSKLWIVDRSNNFYKTGLE